MARKYSRIVVRGHYLFREANRIPDIADDNPTQLVIETARSVDVELKLNDISISHRLPSTNSQRQLAQDYCQIYTTVKRDEVFNAQKKLTSKRTKDLPPVDNAAIHIN